MSTITAIPLRGQPPFLGPVPEPAMPDFGEPILSGVGIPDELSAAYRDSRQNSYAAAHAEADAADEVDELRAQLAEHDMTLEQFAAVMRDQCPKARVILHQHNSVHVMPAEEPGRETSTAYVCWVWFPPEGTPKRTYEEKGGRLDELARLIAVEYRMREAGVFLAVPVVEVATA